MNAKKVTDTIVRNIKKYFEDTGRKTSVVGISGGKDSLVVAMLLKEALGADNVVGVLLPEGRQDDIEDANLVTTLLEIKQTAFNILPITSSFIDIAFSIIDSDGKLGTRTVSDQSKVNLRARIRMAALYYLSQSLDDSCVVGTSNAGEIYTGYTTKYGDNGADVFPIGELHVDEVLEVGKYLIHKHFGGMYEEGQLLEILEKVPADGISGKTDEEALGFTYAEVKSVEINGTCGNKKKDQEIKKAHIASEHKRTMPPIIKSGISRAKSNMKTVTGKVVIKS